VSIGPDGRQAVVQLAEGATGLWLLDLSRNTLAPFVTGGGSSQAPVWTADGRRVAYRATRNGSRNLFWKAADGTGDEERLTSKEGVIDTPTSASPDGQWLVYGATAGQSSGGVTLWRLALRGDRVSQPVTDSPAYETDGQVSTDGKWLAYQSVASGLSEVFVRPFPGPGPSRQVSNGGGTEPLWSRDGRELFYLQGNKLLAVDVATTPTLSVSEPRPLFEGRYRTNLNANTAYGVSADGRRFLRIQQAQSNRAADHVEVVLDWFDELRQLAPGK
jgi:serine/threonine-protein kinase